MRSSMMCACSQLIDEDVHLVVVNFGARDKGNINSPLS